MKITHHIPQSIEEALSKFTYKIDVGSAKYVTCIAYKAVVSDEIMAIYELYFDNEYRFYGTYELDHDDGDVDRTTKAFRSWARASGIKLLDRTDVCFLFELKEPLGIV